MPLPPIVSRKLDRPGEPLCADESIECLVSCINYGAAQAERAKQQELIIVIGNTGGGKSTFVNMVEGCRLQRITKEEAGLVGAGGVGAEDEVIRVEPGSRPDELMKIGHTKKSMTFTPQVEAASSFGAGFAYADCPGFLDNRGFEINVANAVNIKQTIASAASVRVVVLINYQSLLADRGRGVRELCDILQDMFGGRGGLVAHRGSVLVGISQAPTEVKRKGKYQKLSAKAVAGRLLGTEGLPSSTAELIGSLADSIFVFDPCGEGDATWLGRADIINRIKKLAPITDAHSIFRTVLIPEDESGLRGIVGELANRIQGAMDCGAYEDAARMLVQLRRIDRVDNVVCTRLLKGVEEDIDASMRAMEKEAQTIAMAGDFAAATRVLYEELGPAARALESLRGAEATTSLVTQARAFVEQRQNETARLAEALEGLKHANEDRARLDGLVQALTQQIKAGEFRTAQLNSDKSVDEKKQLEREASTREAFDVEKQRLQARIDALSATEEQEREALRGEQEALEVQLRKRLEEQQAQAERDKQAQQALIDASRQQQEQLTQQLAEARAQLVAQQKVVEEQRIRREAVDRSRRVALPKPSDAALRRLSRKVDGSLEGALKSDRLGWSYKSLDAADASVVAYIVSVSGVLKNLDLGENDIDGEGAVAIADALRVNEVLTELNIGDNEIGPEGAKAIGGALAVNGVLKTLTLHSNNIGDEGAKAIGGALAVNGVLKTLDLHGNNIRAEGAAAIAEALRGNAVLTKLNLSYNDIEETGAKALASALRGNGVLTTLVLFQNNIGDEGAKALAAALRVNAVLNNIDLRYCRLGDEGKGAILDAVSGREGFKLEM